MSFSSPTFDDFEVGDFVSFIRSFSQDDYAAFSTISKDKNPLHWDVDYAAETAIGIPIVPLHLTAAPFSAVAGMMIPGRRALYLNSTLRALKPIPYNTQITYSAKVTGKHAGSQTINMRGIAFSAETIFLVVEMLVQVRTDGVEASPSVHDGPLVERLNERGVALITGASGAIGRAVAKAMARRGWDLVLQYNSNADAMVGFDEDIRRTGRDVDLVQARLDTEAGLAKLIKSVSGENAPTVLVHAASSPFDATLNTLMAVNFQAARSLSTALLPEMLRRQQGQVLLLGSSAAHHHTVGLEDYTAAKNAAVGLAASIESRFAAYGIRGKMVAPGYVDTPASRLFRPAGAPTLLPEEVADAVVEHLEGNAGVGQPYLWIEHGFRRLGNFGFSESRYVAPETSSTHASASAAQPVADVGLSTHGNRSANLEGPIRTFLNLPPHYPVGSGGLDITPGWDSLGHIQLMIYIESELGVSFTSGEIAGATNFGDLAKIVERKRSGLA